VLKTYQALAHLALSEARDIVVGARLLGGSQADPNKLRLAFVDGSYLDVWLTADGDYSYHWEWRRQTGRMYRWDNAPHHPQVITFPAHFHDGNEATVDASILSLEPMTALRHVLACVRQRLVRVRE
jgi:hypothetical protein